MRIPAIEGLRRAYRKSDLGNGYKRGRTRRRAATTHNSAIAVVTIVITGAAINHKDKEEPSRAQDTVAVSPISPKERETPR